MTSRTRDDIEADAKARRLEIDGLQEQQFDLRSHRDEMDTFFVEYEKKLREMSQHISNTKYKANKLEDSLHMMQDMQVKSDVLIDDGLHEVSSKIITVNEELDNLGMELKLADKKQESEIKELS